MVSRFVEKRFAFVLLLSLYSSHSTGIFVGFSHEASKKSSITWPPREAGRFLERNMQLKVLLSKPLAILDYVSSAGISINLLVDRHQAKRLLESKFLAARKDLSHMNISSIIVSFSEEGPPLLLSTLHSVQSALKFIDLDQNIKVSAMFSLPTLENLAKNSQKDLQRIIEFVKHTQSFLTVEVLADLTLDDFIHHVIQRAIMTCSLLPNPDIPIVLNLKSIVPESKGFNVAKFMVKMSSSIEISPQLKDRILGFFIHVPSFQSFHRELVEENVPIKESIHDTYPTNPTTIPITVPSTIPTPNPTIVTSPTTNPVTVFPTNPSINPITAPITIPSIHPLPTPITNPANPTNSPITVPAINPNPDPVTNPASPINMPITVPSTNPMLSPLTNPSTNPIFPPPVMPVTNPATTPTTNPANQSVTNPVTTYPFPQPSMAPPVINPVTNPGTLPVSPTGLGQTWCVAKSGLADSALQLALDYACGLGGADCSAIQEIGSCYNPNTLQNHASFAFNSYYQRNPVPSSCDFGGSAIIVTVNPSTATCIYPSSSASGYNPAAGYNPATTSNPATGLNPASGFNPASGLNPTSGFNPASSTGTGSSGSSGSSVLNTNSSGGSSSSSDFGSDNPSSSVSCGSISRLVVCALQIFALASTGNIW